MPLVVRRDESQGNSAGYGFGGGDDIGHHRRIGQLIAEISAGPAHAALYFVEAEQCVVLIRQLARAAAKSGIDRENATFALYPFDKNSRRTLVHRCFESGDIVGRHELHAGHQGLEVLAVLRLPGDGKRAESPAVK